MIWYAKKILKSIEINIIPKTATKLRFQEHNSVVNDWCNNGKEKCYLEHFLLLKSVNYQI